MMDAKTVRQVLETFTVLVDTREQPTARARERYERLGAPWKRATLAYGDYTYDATLPDGSRILDGTGTVRPLCAVERKMGLDELAMCCSRERGRFQRELERAAANGCRMYLLCENATWEGLLAGRYRSRMSPESLFASVTTWMSRYDIGVIFCKEESSGRLIRDVLYRDLRERLRNGEFDRAGGADGKKAGPDAKA